MFYSLVVLLLMQLRCCVTFPRLASSVHSISVLDFIKPTFLIRRRILITVKMLIVIKIVLNVSLYDAIAISGPRPPHFLDFTLTLRQATLGKTLPDE